MRKILEKIEKKFASLVVRFLLFGRAIVIILIMIVFFIDFLQKKINQKINQTIHFNYILNSINKRIRSIPTEDIIYFLFPLIIIIYPLYRYIFHKLYMHEFYMDMDDINIF